jgi:hypothetical protein
MKIYYLMFTKYLELCLVQMLVIIIIGKILTLKKIWAKFPSLVR